MNYLLNGKPNTAHFVKLTWGTVGEKLFLMTQKDIQASISGVENVGLTMPLIEVVENAETLNYPAQFYVAMLYLTNSIEQISVILPAGTYYFKGSAFELTAQTELSPFISSENLIYNEQKQAYGVLLISLNTVTPSGRQYFRSRCHSGGNKCLIRDITKRLLYLMTELQRKKAPFQALKRPMKRNTNKNGITALKRA